MVRLGSCSSTFPQFRTSTTTFLEFVPQHAAFKRRLPTPPSRMIQNPYTNYDYDTVLGVHFAEMFEFYVKTQRYEEAVTVIRNVIVSERLNNNTVYVKLRDRLYELLNNWQVKLDIISLVDVIFYFHDDSTEFSSLSRLIIAETWEKPEVLHKIKHQLSNSVNSEVLRVFSELLAKHTLKQLKSGLADIRQIENGLISFNLLSNSTTWSLIYILTKERDMFDVAFDIVREVSFNSPNIAYKFYGTFVRTSAILNQEDQNNLEAWMDENNFVYANDYKSQNNGITNVDWDADNGIS